MVIGSNILAGASGQGGSYEIDQSIRFNDDDSARMTRTPGSAGNRRTFTFSAWIKRGYIAAQNASDNQDVAAKHIFSASGNDRIHFSEQSQAGAGQRNDGIHVEIAGSGSGVYTTARFSDPGSWYHLVVEVDTTQATASNRIKIYINGSQQTDFDISNYPSQNADSAFNNTVSHMLGGRVDSTSNFFDGYLAEINFIDGTALDPTSFGETNADTGQWVPIKYTGAYSGNSFYLKGQDSSALGDDSSGLGNDFTTTNLAAADQVTDTPTNNFATWNPIIPLSNGSFSDGNLQFTQSGGSISQHAKSTISFTSGEKKVCEMQTVSGSSITLGICDEDFVADANGFSGDSRGYFDTNGNKVDSAGNSSSYGASFSSSNVIRIEVDLSSNPGTIEFFKDGVSQGDAFTDIDSLKTWFFWCRCKADAVKANFGQLGFAGTPTTGFTALSTSNMLDPTIADPGDHFNTVLYTANNTDGHAITGVGFQPDWVWIKDRDTVASHVVFDAVRGVSGGNKFLVPTTTDFEGQGGQTNTLVSLDSDGFTLDDDSEGQRVNLAGPHVAWCWKANGSGSSNSDGSITSTVSANTTSGFSICTFTGNGTSGATFGHGLSSVGAPKMVIVKERSPGGNNWMVGHDSVGWTKYLALDAAQAAITSSARWNDTAPSSTVVTLGDDGGINANTATYVAYCFAEVEGFSKISSFEGNSSADGTFVYTGFKPAFILTKNMDTADQWGIRDAARNPFNVTDKLLNPNAATAETTSSTGYIDILSNGFKARSSDSNINSNTIIYYAVAESPFITATAR